MVIVSNTVRGLIGVPLLAAALTAAMGCAGLRGSHSLGDLQPALTDLPPALSDPFDTADLRGWVADSNAPWTVASGRYTVLTTDDMATAAMNSSSVWSDAYAAVAYIREPGSVGAGGLVLRASPDFEPWKRGSGYLFTIGSDGAAWHAAVIRQVDGKMSFALAWTNIPNFAAGTNLLAAVARGSALQLYINGNLFWEASDTHLASGRVGLFASTSAKFSAVHTFDSFLVKDLKPAPVEMPEQNAEGAPEAVTKTPEQELAPDKEADAPKASAATTREAAQPSNTTADPSDRSPILKPGFLLRVSVLVSGKREIDGEVKRVSDNNKLELPLVGQVSVEGVSLRKLHEILQERYSEFFVNPQVVAEFVMEERPDAISPWGSVRVLGRVRTPGLVNIPPTQDMTLSGAIQQAGGLDTSSRASAIRVTRQKEDGKTERLTVDFTAIGQQGELGNDLLLKPGDVIFVPERIF